MRTAHILTECGLAAACGSAAGAYLSLHAHIPAATAGVAAMCAVVSALALVLFGRSRIRMRRWVLWIISAASLFAAAQWTIAHNNQQKIADWQLRETYATHGTVISGCRPYTPPCSFEALVTLPRRDTNSKPGRQRAHVRIYLREGTWSPLPGDKFSTRGRLRRPARALHPFSFDPYTWSIRQGIEASLRLEDPPRLIGVKPSLRRYVAIQRMRMEYAMTHYGHPNAAGVLVAMSTGTKTGLTDEVRAHFAAAGTAHVLAVSGLHLGLLAAAIWWVLRRFFRCFPIILRRYNADALSSAITLPILGLYVLFTGMPTSAMRAGWMAAGVLIPRIFNRRGSSLHGLCLAILVLLARDPLLICGLSFQLSVAATLSLVVLARHIAARGRQCADDKRALEEAATLQAHDDAQPSIFRFGQVGKNAPTEDGDPEDSDPDSNGPPEQAALEGKQQRSTCAQPSRARRWGSTLRTWLVTGMEVSVVSTLATAPFLVWTFGGIPVLSPLPNLLIVPPLSILALPIGVLGALIHPIVPAAGGALITAALQVIDLCLHVARSGSGLFEIQLLLGRPLLLGVCGWALIAVVSPWLTRGIGYKRWACVIIGILCIGVDAYIRAPAPGTLEIHAIPVGQGDATWIRLPDGRSILIDGGGVGYGASHTGIDDVLPYLRAHGVGHVDILVATHGHADHINGIIELAPVLKPEQIWMGDDDLKRELNKELYDEAQRLHIPYLRPMKLWKEVDIGEVRIEILPLGTPQSINDGSLVLRICYRDFCGLFAGDMEQPRERFLLHRGVDLRAQYLKVGHHGSDTSSSAAFLSAVRPLVAVIELGEHNRFGFPKASVISRLKKRAIHTWRTDRGQAVVHVTDGERLWHKRENVYPDAL